MRLAHLKCPNCDGFVDFNDEQGLFCKSCGSELMVRLDPEDFELEQLKAMPEILNDKYIYERKLYESELAQDEERNKQRLVNEWRQKRPDKAKRKKTLITFYVILGAVVLLFILGSIIISIFGAVQGGLRQYKHDKAKSIDPKGIIKLEQESPDELVSKFALFRTGYPNSLDDITYCMKTYLANVDGQGRWESIEFINAYLGNDGVSSDLICIFEERNGNETVYRAVALDNLMYDPVDHAIVTDMDYHLVYHEEAGLKGAYFDKAECEKDAAGQVGIDAVAYR